MIIQHATDATAGSRLQPALPGGSPDRVPLTVGAHAPPSSGGTGGTGDIVDEWGRQSFPASDPPANW